VNKSGSSTSVADVIPAAILLVEGVPGIGKSTTIDGVVRKYVAREGAGKIRTLVALAQTYTYGPLAAGEDAGTLTRDESLAHLDRIVSGIEWLVTHGRGQGRTKTHIVIDTLHLTHCLRPGRLQWDDVRPIDARLTAAGCRLLLLDAEDDTIRTRTVMARAETEFIRRYARGRFGDSDAALVAHFQHERDRFREMFSQSSMPKMTLTAERGLAENVSAAAAWWSSNE
jgi:hypothetical protein